MNIGRLESTELIRTSLPPDERSLLLAGTE
jgi:hypothetical protein